MESSSQPGIGSAREELRRYRIGSVPYLNAKPLTHGLSDQLVFDVPSRLAKRFENGELDAALIPIYEAVSLGSAVVADDIAIACDGEVYSVFLASREPVAELTSAALDPDSLTSAHLVQVLFAEFFERRVEFTPRPVDEAQARLVIGDPAIEFRATHTGGPWKILDLGAEWKRRTGLPFVFACWVFRPGLEEPKRLGALLRAVKAEGVRAIPEISARMADPEFAARYLTEFVRFDLGAAGKQAVALYAALLRKHGFVASEFQIRYA